MSNFNVIGDIAGNKLTLDALLAKMPKDAIPLSLGDMNDRGPRSLEVIEFFKNNGKATNSNHGHMFVEWFKQKSMPGAHPKYYDDGVFTANGGTATIGNYAHEGGPFKHPLLREHIQYLENLPFSIETDKFFLSHAPLAINMTIEKAHQLGIGFSGSSGYFGDQISDQNLLWNRYVPDRPHDELNGKINIFGHNSSNMVKVYTPHYPNGIKIFPEELANHLPTAYAMCIDTSADKVLTGFNTQTMELYQQVYID